MLIAEKDGVLTQLDFLDAQLADSTPEDINESESALLRKAISQLEEYFAGARQDFDLPLRPSGTDFQQQAWNALRQIPYGETRSYQAQAQAMGHPKAARAVGQANGRNPISIIIPCHRVIGKDGSLTGFGSGFERKSWLLGLEKRVIHG